MVSLGIVVLTTILFYYQYYAISGVGDQVIAGTHISFVFFVNINVVSALLSALTSIAAGITDRYGRANVVTLGVLLCALVCLFGFPNVHSGWGVAVLYTLLGGIEGTVLVATPALVRDFSPQLGRASAMGFWTLGPVAGSLIVSVVVSNTITHLTAWQDQYIIAGCVGLGVFVIAALWLRELPPALRDQILVSERDRALLEARAKGIDVEAALKKPVRQMLHLDIVGSALAISLLLLIYFVAVGFFPIFFQTIFNYSASKANALGNWMWGFQAGSLIIIGYLSDRIRVRKPFMLVGALGAIVCTYVLIDHTAQPHTSYYSFVVLLVVLSIFMGMAFAPWMASFTETVERRNPALTATGLAVWGLIIRAVVTISAFILPYVVNTVTTLVQDGPAVEALANGQDPSLNASQNAFVKAVVADQSILGKVAGAAKYSEQVEAASKLPPAARTAALATVPPADVAYLNEYGTPLQDPPVLAALAKLEAKGPAVEKAVAASPGQWQTYFWIALGGQVVFIPLIFLMAGFWDPRKAKRQEEEHNAMVGAEMAKLLATQGGPADA